MAEKNLIKIYVDASSAKRVDIIIKHYTDFMGIVDGYTEGLRYMIECEKESNSHREIGDLGVRVKTSGSTSDPTAKKAIRNVMTREALINCDFSGNVMDGVDRAEEFIRDAYLLRDMRKDYELFNRQLSILGTEKETFENCEGVWVKVLLTSPMWVSNKEWIENIYSFNDKCEYELYE